MHCYYACLLYEFFPFAIRIKDRVSLFQYNEGANALTFGLNI